MTLYILQVCFIALTISLHGGDAQIYSGFDLPAIRENQSYFFNLNLLQLNQAELDCRSRNSSLVVIESREEFDYLSDLFKDYGFIGYRFWVKSQYNRREFVWLDETMEPVGRWMSSYWQAGWPGSDVSAGEGLALNWEPLNGLRMTHHKPTFRAHYICEAWI